MYVVDGAAREAEVGQTVHTVGNDDGVDETVFKGPGTDIGDTLRDDQFLLMRCHIVERILESLLADILQSVVQRDVIAAVAVESPVVDDPDFGPYGETLGPLVGRGKVRQQSAVVAGIETVVLHHEGRVAGIDGHLSQSAPVQRAVAYMHQRGRKVQPPEQVLREGMVAQPCQRSRQLDALATKAQGIVANLLQRLGQHQALQLLVSKHIRADDIVLRTVVLIVRVPACHDTAVAQVQRLGGVGPTSQHLHVAAVDGADEDEVALAGNVVHSIHPRQATRRDPQCPGSTGLHAGQQQTADKQEKS